MDKEAQKLREQVINILFALCTEPNFAYAVGQCRLSESLDIVGLIDMSQFQATVGQILALIPHKLPKDRPPLLSDESVKRIWESFGYSMFEKVGKGSVYAVSKGIAQAQWDEWNDAIYGEADIKHYESQ